MFYNILKQTRPLCNNPVPGVISASTLREILCVSHDNTMLRVVICIVVDNNCRPNRGKNSSFHQNQFGEEENIRIGFNPNNTWMTK